MLRALRLDLGGDLFRCHLIPQKYIHGHRLTTAWERLPQPNPSVHAKRRIRAASRAAWYARSLKSILSPWESICVDMSSLLRLALSPDQSITASAPWTPRAYADTGYTTLVCYAHQRGERTFPSGFWVISNTRTVGRHRNLIRDTTTSRNLHLPDAKHRNSRTQVSMILQSRPTINIQSHPAAIAITETTDIVRIVRSTVVLASYHHWSAPRFRSVPKSTCHAESHIVLPDEELWA